MLIKPAVLRKKAERGGLRCPGNTGSQRMFYKGVLLCLGLTGRNKAPTRVPIMPGKHGQTKERTGPLEPVLFCTAD